MQRPYRTILIDARATLRRCNPHNLEDSSGCVERLALPLLLGHGTDAGFAAYTCNVTSTPRSRALPKVPAGTVFL